jgi:DNA-binding CsgD family transcriptional regulator
MLFKGGSVPMTQALPADSCDKMRDFLNSILRADTKMRDIGKKIDVAKFLLSYRELYAEHVSANPRGTNYAAILITQRKHREKQAECRQYLIDHSGDSFKDIARALGISYQTVSNYFKQLGIPHKNPSRWAKCQETKGA